MEHCLICNAEVDPQEPGALVRRFASEQLGDAYYCPAHAHRAAERSPRRRLFRLTAGERTAIFAGEHPRIERDPGKPELDVGDIHDLSASVWIAITRKGKNRKGMVQYRYTVHDQRLDRPHLLRQSPPAHRSENEKEVQVLDIASEALAAEESAYTSSTTNAVPAEPEAVSDMQRRALAMSARLRRAHGQSPEQAFEGQVKSFSEAIRGIGRQATQAGIDAGALLAPLLREYELWVEQATSDKAA